MPDLLSELQQALRDRYVIERELGRGGMALVYLARERRYERQVAIKVLDPEVATAVGAERFLREVQITAQLQHPHIVPLLDSGEAAGSLYAVMPYVEGESLRDRLVSVRRLAPQEAVSVACEVADALDYAHRRGVIHRDIKPENILLSNGHAVVADFGVARAIGLAGGATLTGIGLPIGTASYMSPEQAAAAGPLDGRSDIYALGCVLYEMLSGQMAFSGASLKSILTQQLTTDPAFERLVPPEIPDSVTAVVRRALAKQRDARYQTAGEMADALRSTLAELPRVSTPVPRQVTPPDGYQPEVRPATSAGRWLVPAALAVAAVVGVALLWSRPRGTETASVERGASEVTDPYTASVAVLPFVSLNPGSGNEYFTEGITEEIINQLAQVESLKVISRTSVMALKGANLTLPKIADTLGVRHVVEGSVRRQGSRVRVHAELIEAKSDAHLWAGTFEGDMADSFRVQEEIARKVSGQLLSSIRGVPPMRTPAMATQSAAFDAVLRGRYLLEQRTAESLSGAIHLLEDAVRLDSSYATAAAGLSSAYANWVYYGYRGPPDRYEAAAKAGVYADRALALDPNLAEGHQARADALTLANAPNDSIIAELRQALRLTPNSAGIQMSAAFALAQSGRYPQAIQQAQRALSLDPLSRGLRHSLIILALGARQYDLAFDEARRARTLAPADPVPIVLQAYSLLLQGQATRCVGFDFNLWVAVKAMCLQGTGRSREAEVLADSLATRLEAGEYSNAHQYADLAAYHAWLGDANGALKWLERGAQHTPLTNFWQLDSGLFDRVRGDAGFRAGLQRLQDSVRARVAARRPLAVASVE